MKTFFLYLIISRLTGNPLTALIAVILIYVFADKVYFGFLPNFSRMFTRSRQTKNYLNELRFNPENAHASYSLGIIYFEKKNYQKALQYLEHHKLKNESSANYYSYLGMTLFELGKIDEGIKNINKSLRIDPKAGYGLPYIYLIKNEFKAKGNELVIEELERKVDGFASIENLYKLGMIYKKSGNKDKAKNMFSKAIIDYSYCPKGLRKLHRKWMLLSRLQRII
jgi:tetratricopeptide (TPR) repeat protein